MLSTFPRKTANVWSKDEDDRLRKAVEIYGCSNWKVIAQYVGTRDNKMCSRRWRKILDPKIVGAKKGRWNHFNNETETTSITKLKPLQQQDYSNNCLFVWWVCERWYNNFVTLFFLLRIDWIYWWCCCFDCHDIDKQLPKTEYMDPLWNQVVRYMNSSHITYLGQRMKIFVLYKTISNNSEEILSRVCVLSRTKYSRIFN